MFSSETSTLRVSELPNPLTTDIDVADNAGLVRMLASSDALLFTGYGGLPNIYSDEMSEKALKISRAIAAALQHPDGRIVFSGCGTSGRLAHLTARSLNAWMTRSHGVVQPRFDYLLAGKDAALILPQEQVEDQPTAGRVDLENWEKANGITTETPVVVIGISCGLSATYVASMLHAAMERPAYTSVAMGFNPIESIQHVKVDGWDYSFYATLQDMIHKAEDRAVVLNPVAGPETIAGSSRMKGGSITKILCETICTLGIRAAFGETITLDSVREVYMQFEQTERRLYCASAGLESLAEKASQAACTAVSLDDSKAGRKFISPTGAGRILYIGTGTAGLLGLVDASECNPTYGTYFNAVRGFVDGGWDTLRCKEGFKELVVPRHMRGDKGLAISATPDAIDFSLDAFMHDFLPTLSPADLVVLVHLQEAGTEDAAVQRGVDALKAAKAAGASTTYAVVLQDSSAFTGFLSQITEVTHDGILLSLPQLTLTGTPDAPAYLGELAVKLILNAITVSAHVRKGTIYRNRMINVGLTNAKLFHRAIGIVADVTACGTDIAARSMLRSIYHRDDIFSSDGRPLVADFTKTVPRDDIDIWTDASTLSFSDILTFGVSTHVHVASSQLNLVPTAILLAANEHTRARNTATALLTEAEAVDILKKQPVIRKALVSVLSA